MKHPVRRVHIAKKDLFRARPFVCVCVSIGLVPNSVSQMWFGFLWRCKTIFTMNSIVKCEGKESNGICGSGA